MLSRRGFLGGTIGAAAGIALDARIVQQAAAQDAAAPARRRIIVDAQVHQWKAQTPDRPWPPGRVAQLPEPFGYDKLLPMMNEAGVDRVVIVPPSWEGERNDYALEAAGKYPDRFAVMGRILLSSPQAPALLPAWSSRKACSAFASPSTARSAVGSATAPPIGSGRPPPSSASR